MFFSGKVASVVAEVGSLIPRLRASIRKSCRQKVHETAARAGFQIQIVETTCHLQRTFGRWRQQNVYAWVRDCSESSISISHKMRKMRTAKSRRDCIESSVSHKDRKQLRVSMQFWKIKLANLIHSFIHSFVSIHFIFYHVHFISFLFIPFHVISLCFVLSCIDYSIHLCHSFIS